MARNPLKRLFARDERSGKEVKLYGIIDASEDGMSVAEFVAQRLINEILPFEHTGSHIMNNNPTDAQVEAFCAFFCQLLY